MRVQHSSQKTKAHISISGPQVNLITMSSLPVHEPAASGAALRLGNTRQFNIHSPPDIAPNTRVIGLCGVNDFMLVNNETGIPDMIAPEAKPGDCLDGVKLGTASPTVDGWFFSDFFLFEYLLRGQGHSQKWFTCVSPQLLVEKYGQYLHGNPAEHRRVVLDEKLLRQHGNQFHVSPPDRLRSEFFYHLEEQCTAAAALNQPVLVLMFSHGNPKKFGITCGGDKRHIDCPRILPQEFGSRIGSAQASSIPYKCLLVVR